MEADGDTGAVKWLQHLSLSLSLSLCDLVGAMSMNTARERSALISFGSCLKI